MSASPVRFLGPPYSGVVEITLPTTPSGLRMMPDGRLASIKIVNIAISISQLVGLVGIG